MKKTDARRLREQLMRLVRSLRREAQDDGLPWAKMLLLGAIDRHGDAATPSRLAASEGMRSSNIAKALRELEDDRLIRRLPDAADGRKVQVRLTATGRSLLGNSRLRRERWLVEAMQARLTEAERAHLIEAGHLMERLAQFEDDAA